MSDQALGNAHTALTQARALLAQAEDGTTSADSGTTEQVTALLREALAGGVTQSGGDLGRHLVRTAQGDHDVLREDLSLLAVAAKNHGGEDTLSYARAVHLLPAKLTATHYVAAASRLNELLRTAPCVEAMVLTAYMLASGHGYAVNPGLIVNGSYGLGAAVFNAQGRPEWALSITGVGFRFGPDRLPRLGRDLLSHAHQLTAALAASGR